MRTHASHRAFVMLLARRRAHHGLAERGTAGIRGGTVRDGLEPRDLQKQRFERESTRGGRYSSIDTARTGTANIGKATWCSQNFEAVITT